MGLAQMCYGEGEEAESSFQPPFPQVCTGKLQRL